MGKVIAVTNQKGGVGKTTTSVNLAAALARSKHAVLLIDLDPQGNATMGSGTEKDSLSKTINDVLLGTADLQSVIQSTRAAYSLVPANGSLTEAEISLLQQESREQRLLRALARVRGTYDYLIIDCPPSLNMLTINALVAADSVLIPMQCEYYALEGLSSLLDTIEHLRKTANPKLHIEGLLRTMYDGRNCLAIQVSEQLLSHFKEQVYETVIPRNVRLAEAPSHGLPAILYDKYSAGAQAYIELAREIVKRREQEMLATERAKALS
jgi:chromosome partitioning protein